MRPNQVWATDITYVPMARGFVYLIAIVDWFSPRVLSWRLSITMETDFCVEALEEALTRFGTPDIFNTDQCSQFAGATFTSVLLREKIAISMDGRGAWRNLPNSMPQRSRPWPFQIFGYRLNSRSRSPPSVITLTATAPRA